MQCVCSGFPIDHFVVLSTITLIGFIIYIAVCSWLRGHCKTGLMCIFAMITPGWNVEGLKWGQYCVTEEVNNRELWCDASFS